MRSRLLLAFLNVAVLAAWFGGWLSESWPDGHLF
jgi:hypothetical protein